MPADTSAAAVWGLRPARLWRLVLDGLPEDDRRDVRRYVADHLSALLEVENFEKDVLSDLTGEAALVLSHTPDPWMGLASGRPGPTSAIVLRLQGGAEWPRHLRRVLKTTAAALGETDRKFDAEVALDVEHRGRKLQVLTVRRRGANGTASAGYFVEPMPEDAGGGALLVASTSAAWLRRAVDTKAKREDSGPGVPFGGAADVLFSGGPIRCFVEVDKLAEALLAARDGDGPAAWLRLLGTVGMDAEIRPDGVMAADVYVPAE
jgi:hypothetical protein